MSTSSSSEAISDVDQSLATVPAHLVRRVHQRHARLWSDVVGDDPTPPQYAVLHVVGEHPGIDLTELGARAALDRTTVGRVVDRLLRDGLVDRRADEDDRRRLVVTLTAAGRDRLAVVTPLAAEASRRLLAGLTTDRADSLLDLLRAMLDDDEDDR